MLTDTREFIIRAAILFILIGIAIGCPYFITHHTDLNVPVQRPDHWSDKQINKFINSHHKIKAVETKEQIIVEAGSKVDNVLVIYKGDKSPIVVKEENTFCKTGIQMTVITPNDIKKLVTQH